MPRGVAAQLIDSLHAAVQILEALDAPVIASLQGAVAGGSMSLALSADLAIAAENASFNLAYARIGASCDLSSSWHLPRLVGLRRAMEIALLSESHRRRRGAAPRPRQPGRRQPPGSRRKR